MLELKNISKSFDGVHAVQDVSLSVQPRKITSLIGPNGAGKTTLFNVITGFLNADGGEVRFGSESLEGLAPWRIARLGVSRTFQNLRLFRKLTALENVLLGIKGQKGEGFLNALVGFSSASAGHVANLRTARELLGLVGLEAHENELADNLSYGQQKLLSIACCVAGSPQILLLDEPVSGVQPEMIKKIEALIRMLVKEQGKTAFLIEHDMDFVLRISDTVVLMDEGHIIVEQVPESIKSNPKILETYLS
jgi:branched-chain amino acid transport system ATP-binding protein